MAITINDVARAAGVSKSTVSKVLNNTGTISTETVSKVQDAIKKLNYVPNSRAVSFARQSTNNIVYLTDLSPSTAFKNPHNFDIMCGVYQEISKAGYLLSIVDTSKDSFPGETALKEIEARSADGLVIHGSAINEKLGDRLIKENIPHIIIGKPDFESRLCWIDTNHSLAGEYAANHMTDCNYSDIVFIAGKKSDEISNQRLKGLRKGLASRNKFLPIENIIYTDRTRQNAYELMAKFLKKHVPDAIVCEDNTLALGATKAITDAGLTIPADVGFLTFDVYPYSSIMDPTPTVIDINVFDIGVQAGSLMLRKLETPELLIQSFTTLPVLNKGGTTSVKIR